MGKVALREEERFVVMKTWRWPELTLTPLRKDAEKRENENLQTLKDRLEERFHKKRCVSVEGSCLLLLICCYVSAMFNGV